jgi:hypothetical protein
MLAVILVIVVGFPKMIKSNAITHSPASVRCSRLVEEEQKQLSSGRCVEVRQLLSLSQAR